MLFSLAIIMIMGLLLGEVCKRFHLPMLIGMLAVGVIIGPYALNWIDGSILTISPQLRKIALIIILTRAGLSLNIGELRKNGRSAVLMCFVPACFEILGMILFAPVFLNITHIEAAIMGAVIGAVSPAVIVPKMLKLSDEGYGKENGIPQLLMAGASVDDIFVIVMFSAFVCLEQTGNISVMSFAKIPVSIILGIIAGGLIGVALSKLFKRVHIRDTVKIILILSMSLLLSALEDSYGNTVPFSAMIAVMCIGISIQKERPAAAKRLSERYSKLWVFFEIFIFYKKKQRDRQQE